MLSVIALLAVGTGCANKNDVNNNADNNIKVAEQRNNEESLDEENRILYENCINLNIGDSCNSLGYAYSKGQGVKQDYSKANIYYEKACNLNDGNGCFNLGIFYAKGKGVNQDYKKANTYYEKACNLNYGGGCHNLGYSYDSGIGVKQDYKKANTYYEKACNLMSVIL